MASSRFFSEIVTLPGLDASEAVEVAPFTGANPPEVVPIAMCQLWPSTFNISSDSWYTPSVHTPNWKESSARALAALHGAEPEPVPQTSAPSPARTNPPSGSTPIEQRLKGEVTVRHPVSLSAQPAGYAPRIKGSAISVAIVCSTA